MLDWFNYLYKHSYCIVRNDSKWFAPPPRRRSVARSSLGFGWPWRWHLLCALWLGLYLEYFAAPRKCASSGQIWSRFGILPA
jgi:hypothetical protein